MESFFYLSCLGVHFYTYNLTFSELARTTKFYIHNFKKKKQFSPFKVTFEIKELKFG